MSNNNELLLRQWSMLRMIPRFPRKVTAREMLERLSTEGFSVTKRTIERDLQGISLIFPLVADEREKPYGWSWAKDVPSFDLPGLSIGEAIVFKMAQQYLNKLLPLNMLAQLTPYFLAADKSLNGRSHDYKLTKWQKKIAVAYPGQPLLAPNIDQDILLEIESALLEERQLKVNYFSRNESSPSEYLLHPLGIVLRGQISYLVCTIFDYEDIRMLAIHRISQAVKQNDTCKRPKNFSLQEYSTSSAFGFDNNGQIELILKFIYGAGQHLLDSPLISNQKTEVTKDGYLILKAKIADNAQLRWWILGFGDQVEVLEPAKLRNQIADTTKATSRLYE